MDKKERLAICANCSKRKLDYEHGYICQLTNRFADFEGTCKHYALDQSVSDTIEVRTKERPFVPLFNPPSEEEIEKRKTATEQVVEAKIAAARKAAARKAAIRKAAPAKAAAEKPATGEAVKKDTATEQDKARPLKPSKVALKKLRRYQSFLYALIGGLLITAAAAVGWAYFASLTGHQGAFLALGVGLLVGFFVRFFGAGTRWFFGFLAALLTLVGSLLGYVLSQNGFLEGMQLAGILDIPGYLDPGLMISTMVDSFVPFDLLFYGLAGLLAWLIAIRRINPRKMARLEEDGYRGAPALYWLRLPLIVAGILLPAYYGYTLTNNSSIELQTRFYDSGKKLSEGHILNGLETGEWTSWYEDGVIQCLGHYDNGRKDSLWQWFDETGILTGTGMYEQDVKHGTWMHYFPDGVVSDSGSYFIGTQEGLWKYYHPNGNLKYAVQYKTGKMHGEKILLTPSGTVINIAYYNRGVQVESGE